MIEVVATLRIYADSDKEADEVLRQLLAPVKGATVHVTGEKREHVR